MRALNLAERKSVSGGLMKAPDGGNLGTVTVYGGGTYIDVSDVWGVDNTITYYEPSGGGYTYVDSGGGGGTSSGSVWDREAAILKASPDFQKLAPNVQAMVLESPTAMMDLANFLEQGHHIQTGGSMPAQFDHATQTIYMVNMADSGAAYNLLHEIGHFALDSQYPHGETTAQQYSLDMAKFEVKAEVYALHCDYEIKQTDPNANIHASVSTVYLDGPTATRLEQTGVQLTDAEMNAQASLVQHMNAGALSSFFTASDWAAFQAAGGYTKDDAWQYIFNHAPNNPSTTTTPTHYNYKTDPDDPGYIGGYRNPTP